MVITTSKPTSGSMFLKETSEETFSANYVLHAYEEGKKKAGMTR